VFCVLEQHVDQLLHFQVRQKEQGDDEAQGIDETYVDAFVFPFLTSAVLDA
jgi:hypothetical protein